MNQFEPGRSPGTLKKVPPEAYRAEAAGSPVVSLMRRPMGTAERSDAAATRRISRPRPPKLYRIGEIVAYSTLSRQTVHNYTTMGLLREVAWTDGGHRLYDESVFERLDMIAELRAQGRSIEAIREHFAATETSDVLATETPRVQS